MTGTPSQIEMANQIRPLVEAEFDRVARAFEVVALTQTGEIQAETRSILEILATKRAEVLARAEAGYFITTWRELSDQVRRLIFADPAYKAIQLNRAILLRKKRVEVTPSPASV